ncbi:hypothetical protein QQF10_07785 [Clostridium perfringens]
MRVSKPFILILDRFFNLSKSDVVLKLFGRLLIFLVSKTKCTSLSFAETTKVLLIKKLVKILNNKKIISAFFLKCLNTVKSP